eukprot:TRINITY_DN9283_c0_g1_i1.p1 TRINITY_DN9283_c0_g1~~TRINITY_DN9283_c0_g1_i1.p1  ORF type:complete len:508 (+),score=52.08 TRINITY_DN9283_c0_g1_i1:26-1549(+)
MTDVLALYHHKLCKIVVEHWKQLVQSRKHNLNGADLLARAHFRSQLLARTFNYWKAYILGRKLAREAKRQQLRTNLVRAELVLIHTLLHRFFQLWRVRFTIAVQDKRTALAAVDFFNLKLLQRAFVIFRDHVKNLVEEKAHFASAKDILQSNKRKRLLHLWHKKLHLSTQSREHNKLAAEMEAFKLLKYHFNSWIAAKHQRHSIQQKMLTAVALSETMNLTRALRAWRNWLQNKIAQRAADEIAVTCAAEQLRSSRLRSLFSIWRKRAEAELRHNLLLQNARQTQRLALLTLTWASLTKYLESRRNKILQKREAIRLERRTVLRRTLRSWWQRLTSCQLDKCRLTMARGRHVANLKKLMLMRWKVFLANRRGKKTEEMQALRWRRTALLREAAAQWLRAGVIARSVRIHFVAERASRDAFRCRYLAERAATKWRALVRSRRVEERPPKEASVVRISAPCILRPVPVCLDQPKLDVYRTPVVEARPKVPRPQPKRPAFLLARPDHVAT